MVLLSVFFIQDVANQLRHSVRYQDACAAKGLRPGKFLSVPMGEYLSGLPAGWTSPRAGAVNRARVDAQFAGKASLINFGPVGLHMSLNVVVLWVGDSV